VHTDEPVVYKPEFFENEVAIEMLKRYKLQDTDQVPTQLIQARGSTFLSVICELIILF
jgi:hypothetical protein